MRLRKKPWISQALEDYKGKELLEDGLEAYKGKWRALLGDKPLYLEIGCGKGQFISQMAQLHPENAYLGIETQRDVCYYAVKNCGIRKLIMPVFCGLMRPICLTGSKKGKWKGSTSTSAIPGPRLVMQNDALLTAVSLLFIRQS